MAAASDSDIQAYRQRHLRLGWILLALFLALGAVLEGMHGFKVDWYLAVGNETRRLMWRLAHAHGTFLALVHLAFAVTLPCARRFAPRLAAACLTGATVALPGGFLLGGIGVQSGDPGVGVLLVPVGAVLLLIAALRVGFAVDRAPRGDSGSG